MMKKIGILTFHRPINYGAVLQSIALGMYLEEKGYKCELIDYRLPQIEQGRKIFCVNSLLKEGVINSVFSLLRQLKNAYFKKDKINKFDDFLNKNANLSEKLSQSDFHSAIMNSDYEVVITGADLTWNWSIFNGPIPEYFWWGITSKVKKISYAASIGEEYIPDTYKEQYSKYLNNMDYISVREKTAVQILSAFTDKVIYNVLDPTLLLSAEVWRKLEENILLPEKYIVVYAVEDSELLNAIVKRVMIQYGCKALILIKSKGLTGLNCINPKKPLSPGQFLRAIELSQAVITNSFHGMAFSIIFKKEFWCVPHSARASRMIDLAKILGLEDRIITSLDKMTLETINTVDVEKKLTRERKKSIEYLINTIND